MQRRRRPGVRTDDYLEGCSSLPNKVFTAKKHRHTPVLNFRTGSAACGWFLCQAAVNQCIFFNLFFGGGGVDMDNATMTLFFSSFY